MSRRLDFILFAILQTLLISSSRAAPSSGFRIGVIIVVRRWFEVVILLFILAVRSCSPGVVLFGVGLAVLLGDVFSRFFLLACRCFALEWSGVFCSGLLSVWCLGVWTGMY